MADELTSTWKGRIVLHDRALDVARRLVTRFGPRLPEDVRTVAGYWQVSLLAADRAAEQLVAYASHHGIHPEAHPTPSSRELGPCKR
jgi:hypothetical protein